MDAFEWRVDPSSNESAADLCDACAVLGALQAAEENTAKLDGDGIEPATLFESWIADALASPVRDAVERHFVVDASSPANDPSRPERLFACVTRVAVAALNQYVGPRRIFFVTRDETRCDLLRAFASNVECAAEDALVPGLTKRAVADELRRLSSSSSSDADDDDDDDATHMGRTNAGWYLQQLLKLGAAAHVRATARYLLGHRATRAISYFRCPASQRMNPPKNDFL